MSGAALAAALQGVEIFETTRVIGQERNPKRRRAALAAALQGVDALFTGCCAQCQKATPADL